MAVVSSDGSVLWIPIVRMKSSCIMDLTHFPADTQTCGMKFASWTYSGLKVSNLF